MFTLKFYRYEENATTMCAISCPHYSVYDNGVEKLVTTYKDHMDTTGVERTVGEKLRGGNTSEQPVAYNVGYDVCYVENEAGKTIDTIRKDSSK